MRKNHERGMALILALFMMTALSALGASLMFLSQTEIYSSMNYRMMSQGRYAAEAGVHKAASYLLDPAYPVPAYADIGTIYDTTKSPVTCLSGCPNINQPVVLSAISTQASNYPVAAVQTAFDTAAKGTLAANDATITYGAYAVLISMQRFDSYGGTQSVVQTWQITGAGSVGGSRPATVEVVSVIETPKVPANTMAAFATDDTCGALTFNGNITIDSYDSTGQTGGAITLENMDGDVGSNGNLTINGGAASVEGNLYTPRSGVGTCAAGAVTAFTGSTATIDGSVVQLPKPVIYPTPTVLPYSPVLPISLNSSVGACLNTQMVAAMVLNPMATCSDTGGVITINGNGSTVSLPSITLGGGTKLVLVASSPPAKYDVNSISLNGGSSIGISATSPTQNALVNVVGKDNTGMDIPMPIDFVGGTFAAVTRCATCSNFDASMLQFIYGGTGEVRLTGNSGAAATFYAPNAQVQFSGMADLYGSILGKRINNIGSANIHYDRRLQHDFYIAGLPMASTFSWKRS